MTNDWLPPILVKEMRQGLKSRGFAVGFLGMQGLMALSMVQHLLALTKDRSAGDLEEANLWFWGMMAVVTLGVMPARACFAISSERKNKTLELVLLSRMGSRAILYGKWFAHAAQTLLILSAVPPYMIFRHYFGAVNVADDLGFFLLMTCFSLTLLAMAAGVSASVERFSRHMLLWTAALALGFSLFFLFEEFYVHQTGGVPMVWDLLLMSVLSFFFITVFSLEAGTSVTAPEVHRSCVFKRVAALGVLTVWTGYAVYKGESDYMLFSALLFLPMGAEALCEPPRAVPGRRGGFFNKILSSARFLLQPGWKSALVFYSLLFLISGQVIRFVDKDPEVRILNHGFYNFLVFPLALLFLLPHRTGNRIGVYMLIQLPAFLISVVYLIVDLGPNEWATFFSLVLPLFGMVHMMESTYKSSVVPPLPPKFFLFLATFLYLLVPLMLVVCKRDSFGQGEPPRS